MCAEPGGIRQGPGETGCATPEPECAPPVPRTELHWHEAQGVGSRELKIKSLPGRVTQFAICIETGDYAASLERWKVYPVLPDADAEAHDQIRVVDESGEDYLYPKEYFRPVELPSSVADRYHAARG